MASSHWIGSVRFELRSNDERALDPVRRLIRQEHEQLLLRPLGRALGRADRRGEILRLKRIELDLGTIAPDGLGEALERLIAERLPGSLRWEGGSADRPAISGQAADILLSFLETGLIPFASPGEALETLSLILAGFEPGRHRRLTLKLGSLFARSPAAALRFARQCPIGLVAQILFSLAGVERPREGGGVSARRYAGDGEAARLAGLILSLARGEAMPADERRWLCQLVGDASTIDPDPVPGGKHAAPPSPAASPGPPVADALRTALQGRDIGISDRAAEEHRPDPGYPLHAAGLVLIHPFVDGLMRAFGLIDENGSFRGEKERERGVLLLYLAATGACEACEPELLLAKLLLGLEPGDPVPRSIEPTLAELDEINQMLSAAIAHWGALGDSSPEALRISFLSRPGRLSRAGGDWRLEVEPSGIDVLIDRLPWAIGLVLTPFMARPLRVEWR